VRSTNNHKRHKNTSEGKSERQSVYFFDGGFPDVRKDHFVTKTAAGEEVCGGHVHETPHNGSRHVSFGESVAFWLFGVRSEVNQLDYVHRQERDQNNGVLFKLQPVKVVQNQREDGLTRSDHHNQTKSLNVLELDVVIRNRFGPNTETIE